MASLPNSAAQVPEKRLSDLDLRMAKVSERKFPGWDQQIGQAIDAAISMSNRTQKEAWAEMGYDSGAQLAQWISGERPANFARLFAIVWLRKPLVICLAGLVEEIQVETTLRMRI